MPLPPGEKLGPYEILAPLGTGGMGEVYRARDTRLGREVAVKILPADFAKDPARRQRFELEAHAVAALTHPNIVAVYDVGEGYIVSELVDGEPLRAGKYGLRKTIELAVQIAGGLACAHDAGITHRDLKPANILVTRDGRAKILDFGLAKMAEPHAAAGGATQTIVVNTEPGVVMGTVGYMSPEQVRGKAADNRSDIFSFGVILYELLAGKRAFQADTSAETMTAILKQEPPDLPETVPAGIRQLIANCLEKDPTHRFQSARDLSMALSALSQAGSGSGPAKTVSAPSKIRSAAIAIALGAALIVSGIFAGRLTKPSVSPQAWSAVMLGGPERAAYPRPSPDGHLLAFFAPDSEGFEQIWVMKPETGNRVMLTHDRDLGWVQALSWAPDGARIYFDRNQDQPKGVFSVPVLGGEEQTVRPDAGTPEGLPDGSLLLLRLNAEHQSQLFQYWPDSGKLRAFPLLLNFANGSGPRAFPDGRRVAVIGVRAGANEGSRLYVLDLGTGGLRSISGVLGDAAISAAAPSCDGQTVLLAAPSGNGIELSAIPLDGSAARPLMTLTSQLYSLDPRPDGSIYLDQVAREAELLRFDPAGGHVERIARVDGAAALETVAALPDGRVAWPERSGGRDRLMAAAAGKDPVALVNTMEDASRPIAAAGSGAVAFLVGAKPSHTIALADVATGRITARIPFDKGPVNAIASSRDAKTLYCAAGGSIWAVPVSGAPPRKIRAGDGVALNDDGASLIVASIEPPRSRLFRVPLDGGAEQEMVLTGPYRLGAFVDPGSVRNGRMVASLGSTHWYNPPGIFDLATGKSKLIPLDYIGDFWHMTWSPDGKVIGEAHLWQSTMWKFTPEKMK